MTTVTMTRRGNIKVDGIKFYAVPVAQPGPCDCPLATSKGGANHKCGPVHCLPTERPDDYRLAGRSVVFISKERYDTFKAAKEVA